MANYTEGLRELTDALDMHRADLTGGDMRTVMTREGDEDTGRITVYRPSYGVLFSTVNSFGFQQTVRFDGAGMKVSTDITSAVADDRRRIITDELGHYPPDESGRTEFIDIIPPTVEEFGCGDNVVGFMAQAAQRIINARALTPDDNRSPSAIILS